MSKNKYVHLTQCNHHCPHTSMCTSIHTNKKWRQHCRWRWSVRPLNTTWHMDGEFFSLILPMREIDNNVISNTFGCLPGYLITFFAGWPPHLVWELAQCACEWGWATSLSPSAFTLQGSASKLWQQVTSWVLQLWAVLSGRCAMLYGLGSGMSLWLFQRDNSGRESGEIFGSCGIIPPA